MFAFAMLITVVAVTWVYFFVEKHNKLYESGTRKEDALITSTKIVSINGVSYTKTEGAVGRGIIGGILGGETGAMLGALTAPTVTHSENHYTFLVSYSTGEVKKETVSDQSGRFQFLMSKLGK